MDIKEIVNTKGAINAAADAAVAAGTAQDLSFLQPLSRAGSVPMSETASDRGDSSHDSEHSRYSGPRVGYLNGMGSGNMYHTASSHQTSSAQQGNRKDSSPDIASLQQHSGASAPIEGHAAQRGFLCPTCGKGFARRSDLARHERIHTGHRPHVCDYAGCGKQFIQRSALTVHKRVHTGEKPHVCERCSKSFSDSSSLARHRRIHSGKRPYKCPYADCQKTFTRRTTLTRHQNHHTGTVEDAAVATAAALAAHAESNRESRPRSGGELYSNAGSPMSTPSPGRRDLTSSPRSETPSMSSHRTHDFSFASNGSLPGHLRGEFSMPNQHPMSNAPYTNAIRPTSHPAGYDPPSVLEPSKNGDRQSRSASASPHLSGVGWQSPSQMSSPTASSGYAYPETNGYGHVFYPDSNLRRPQSSESEGYGMKPRMSEMWTAAQ